MTTTSLGGDTGIRTPMPVTAVGCPDLRRERRLLVRRRGVEEGSDVRGNRGDRLRLRARSCRERPGTRRTGARRRTRQASLRAVRSVARRRLARLAALVALAAADPWVAAADPASAEDVCPAIAEGFALCVNDLRSGNCAEFVQAADALAQLYQIQVAEAPDRAPMLLATNWWGCGNALLGDMKLLLLRLGSPGAQAVLQQEPFSRLPSPAPPAPPPPPARVEVDCSNQPTPDACAARELAAAKAAYQAALGTCRTAVASPLRDAFDGSEQAWQQELPAQCDGAGLEYDQPRLQAFARSQCFASAYRERTRGMLLAHPECRAPG
jgi:hypothetical protein